MPEPPAATRAQRELILENLTPGEKQLSFMLTDKKHGHHKIPLYRGQTVIIGEEPDKWPVALVPTFFVREDYDQADPEDDTLSYAPLRNGWLYIYVNGYLWRELQVIRGGTAQTTFKDVNLAYERRAFPRDATGQDCHEVVLPARLNYEDTEVQVAFSEEQWHWSRIDQLGGMNADDPRQFYPNQGSEKNISPYSEGFCAEQRAQRLTALTELSAHEDKFENVSLDSAIRLMTNEALNPYYRDHLNTQFDKGVPAVVVPDPIGRARYYANSQNEMLNLLDATVKTMFNAERPAYGTPREQQQLAQHVQQVADCRLAALFNSQYFAPIDQQLENADLSKDARERLEDRVDERELLDKDLMEKQLNKEGCEQLIMSALDYRSALITLMDDPAFLAAMQDYSALEHGHWFLLPELMGQLIARFNQPCALAYKDLFFDLNDYKTYLESDLGADFLQRLTGSHATKPEHPLAALVFPKAGNDENNPLNIDEGAPEPEDLRLNPKKISAIMEGLNGTDYLRWPKVIIDGKPVDDLHAFATQAIHTFTLSLAAMPPPPSEGNNAEGALLQTWRFLGHAIHATSASAQSSAYKSVQGIQEAEQRTGASNVDRDVEALELEGKNKRRAELESQQQAYDEKIKGHEYSLNRNKTELERLSTEKEQLLAGRTPEALKQENAFLANRVQTIETQITELTEEVAEEQQVLRHTAQKRRHAQRALTNIDDSIHAMTQADGVLSKLTLKHNTRVVNLYSLLAGDNLQALSISQNDLLRDRIPDGLIPISTEGRLQRLESLLATAKRIKNHRGEWVAYEITPDKRVRVPADMALKETEKLQQYLSWYVHCTLDNVKATANERITQIVYSQKQLTSARALAELQIIDNESRVLEADMLEEKAANVRSQMTIDETGLHHYKNKFSANGKELVETEQLISNIEHTIDNLETTINKYQRVLDDGALQKNFNKKMNRLLLMNGGLMVFECFNLSSALNNLTQDFTKHRNQLDFFSAVIDFGATIASAKRSVFEAKYGSTKDIAARLKDPTREAYVKTLKVDKKIRAKSIKITNWSVGFNVGSGVISAVISSIDAHNRWLLGDRNAAVAYGATAVGFLITAAAALPVLASFALTLNIAGFVFIAIGFLCVYFLTDTPGETLLKNSPFGKDSDLRFGESSRINNWLSGEAIDFSHWETHRDQAYHECLSFFFKPRIYFTEQWFYNSEFCEITLQTPGLSTSGIYIIDLQIENAKTKAWETMTMISNNPNHRQNATNPNSVMITQQGPNHYIRLHQSLLSHYGLHRGSHKLLFFGAVNTAESRLRIRVQTYPLGEQGFIFPGASIHYVLPAPKRDATGQALVNNQLESESTVAQHCWETVEGRVIFTAY